jgi:polyisoprenoid-binding protein YceI
MKHFLFMILFLSTALFAIEYHVDKEQKNQVKFTSDAPIEEIVGVTDKIDGYVMWEGDDPTANSEFYFEVDLASIDTGIGLRNRHLRDNYLETDKYPFASYAGKITKATAHDDDSFSITTTGLFKLHGVEKEIEVNGLISKTDTGYKAESQFSVKLDDYNIERPQVMMLKIGEVIQLDVQIFTTEFKE